MLTDERLAEIEARAQAATDGPWQAALDRPSHPSVGDITAPGNHHVVCFGHDYDEYGSIDNVADAAFIAHARDDIPALLAEVRRLREQASCTYYSPTIRLRPVAPETETR